uniref:Zinc finger protein 467 n=1 Tax=Panthera tigris altaica TaxID=74533 RepID=A0A8C9JJ09_PANTA
MKFPTPHPGLPLPTLCAENRLIPEVPRVRGLLPQEELPWVAMRETFEALSSLGFSVGQPEMAPQSEPGEGSHNTQEQMSPPREDSVLGTCSGHEAPRPEEGAQTEEAEAPCRGGQACAPQKAEPPSSCPGESSHFSSPPGAQAEGTGDL